MRIDFDPQLQADLDNGRIPFGLIQAFEGNNIRLGFSPPDAADVSVQQAGAKWTFNHAVRYVVEKKGNQLEVYRKGVKAILEDRHGTLWFATPGGGVKVGIPTH